MHPSLVCCSISIFHCKDIGKSAQFTIYLSLCPQNWCLQRPSRRQCRREHRTWKWLTGDWSGCCATPLLSRAGASSSQRATLSAHGRQPPSTSRQRRRHRDEAIFLLFSIYIHNMQSNSFEYWMLPIKMTLEVIALSLQAGFHLHVWFV